MTTPLPEQLKACSAHPEDRHTICLGHATKQKYILWYKGDQKLVWADQMFEKNSADENCICNQRSKTAAAILKPYNRPLRHIASGYLNLCVWLCVCSYACVFGYVSTNPFGCNPVKRGKLKESHPLYSAKINKTNDTETISPDFSLSKLLVNQLNCCLEDKPLHFLLLSI